MGLQRVGHNLVTEQQRQLCFYNVSSLWAGVFLLHLSSGWTWEAAIVPTGSVEGA